MYMHQISWAPADGIRQARAYWHRCDGPHPRNADYSDALNHRTLTPACSVRDDHAHWHYACLAHRQIVQMRLHSSVMRRIKLT